MNTPGFNNDSMLPLFWNIAAFFHSNPKYGIANAKKGFICNADDNDETIFDIHGVDEFNF